MRAGLNALGFGSARRIRLKFQTLQRRENSESSANQTFLSSLLLEGPNFYYLAFVIDESIPKVRFRLGGGVRPFSWSEELELALLTHSHAGRLPLVFEDHKIRLVHANSVAQAYCWKPVLRDSWGLCLSEGKSVSTR